MTNASQKDIPLPVALVGLLLTALFVPVLQGEKESILNAIEVARSIANSPEWFVLLLSSFLLSLSLMISGIKRSLGLKRQGAKLGIVRGQSGLLTIHRLASGLLSILFIAVVSYCLKDLIYGELINRYRGALLGGAWYPLSLVLSASIAFNFLVFVFFLTRLFRHHLRNGTSSNILSKAPSLQNGITLGSIHEESQEQKPQWVQIHQKSLNGNVLVTGSIGSGKTQGTILPYLEQLLQNFDNQPALLAIDPKRTFLKEAENIIRHCGRENDVVCITLDGGQTFNPVYVPRVLQNSRFVEIAEMIRAASVNLMGQSKNTQFWDFAAVNLLKNSIIYCAATLGYYTLNDIYQVIVRAQSEKISTELIAIVKKKKDMNGQDVDFFDEEEKFNILSAASYFEKEFSTLDQKIQTSVLVTATTFLNLFKDFRASKIFCPKKEDLTIHSMDELVDSGKLILFDVENPGLAKTMGTFIKLHYQQSVLNRLANPHRSCQRPALMVIDEYQDVVTVGQGSVAGDEKTLAKGREANIITLVATQSYSSLANAIGNHDATKELVQNFRTKVCCHSTDLPTIKMFQELAGSKTVKKSSHSFSEIAVQPRRNFILGGFDSENASLSESINTSEQKEAKVTGHKFSTLTAFEAFALVLEGAHTRFYRLFLKPYFLKEKNITHHALLQRLSLSVFFIGFLSFFSPNPGLVSGAWALPSACSAVRTRHFEKCLEFTTKTVVGGFPPRPMAEMSYYIPMTFVEIWPNGGKTWFQSLPGVAGQMALLSPQDKAPFGLRDDLQGLSAFHGHVLSVPFQTAVFGSLPCLGVRLEKPCFDIMSEHLGRHWKTGEADQAQPRYLAWKTSPKSCLLKGAAMSASGHRGSPRKIRDKGLCSLPLPSLPLSAPSNHPACNGWGLFYPRSGVVSGGSSVGAALMVASRLRSFAGENLFSTPLDTDEKWQVLRPNASHCFREGQNVSILEVAKGVNELGRAHPSKLQGFLFVVWKKVRCKRDLPLAVAAKLQVAALKLSCQVIGSL